MQYGHCVVSATATAINSLYLRGIVPCLNAASSNATKLLNASGASWASFSNFVRFFMSYIAISLMENLLPANRPQLYGQSQCTQPYSNGSGRQTRCTRSTPPAAAAGERSRSPLNQRGS